LLKVPIPDDEEDERARLMRLSKSEVIEELLRMKVSLLRYGSGVCPRMAPLLYLHCSFH
jgi:hypothetical protein